MIRYRNSGVGGMNYATLEVEKNHVDGATFTVIPKPKSPSNLDVVLDKAQCEHLYQALGVLLGHKTKEKKNPMIDGKEI